MLGQPQHLCALVRAGVPKAFLSSQNRSRGPETRGVLMMKPGERSVSEPTQAPFWGDGRAWTARLQGARSSQSKRAAAALAPQASDTLCYPGQLFHIEKQRPACEHGGA